MAQKANLATGKSKVISTGQPPAAKTATAKPFPKNPVGNKNGNKRQAPSVTTSGS
jgi:hypothetical protein